MMAEKQRVIDSASNSLESWNIENINKLNDMWDCTLKHILEQSKLALYNIQGERMVVF